MNKEKLRRAVELAGWKTTRLGDQRVAVFIPHPEPTPNGELLRIGFLDEQHVIDALAAQLVRQVDALDEDDVWLEISSAGGVRMWRCMEELCMAIDGDRTENTINCILDSKILEPTT